MIITSSMIHSLVFSCVIVSGFSLIFFVNDYFLCKRGLTIEKLFRERRSERLLTLFLLFAILFIFSFFQESMLRNEQLHSDCLKITRNAIPAFVETINDKDYTLTATAEDDNHLLILSAETADGRKKVYKVVLKGTTVLLLSDDNTDEVIDSLQNIEKT